MKKTWQEKLKDSKDLPKVVTLKKEAQAHWHGKTMAIPAPLEVNKIMASVPKGKLITIDVIRQKIAQKHKTDIGCPLTTGIFSWIAAHAAEEAKVEGKKQITPWWRTLKSDGSLNEKYPGGAENQGKLLQKEGHQIIQKGKKVKVLNFEKALAKV
ncbi:MAG: MGMT family protein [Patescibacteria group bacterium]|nr:MGMT family protein [Patescibacteria group bacterium]